jgi:hypothetical protein
MGLFECVDEMEEAVEGLLECCIVVVMLRSLVLLCDMTLLYRVVRVGCVACLV